jgi:K+-transporting ATPase ATPase C chain
MYAAAMKQIKTAFILLILFSLLTGVIYPLLVTGMAQILFPYQANGSLIINNGKIIGSQLIGQSFTSPGYFWGRPSATTPYPYNAANSTGSNMGPSNPDFIKLVYSRVDTIRQADPENRDRIPVDLVTASGSGLDPEISPLAAYYQVPRIAKARGMSEQDIQSLIQQLTKNRTFGILGEPRVNVLNLNIALDSLQKIPLEEFFRNNEGG